MQLAARSSQVYDMGSVSGTVSYPVRAKASAEFRQSEFSVFDLVSRDVPLSRYTC